MRHATPRSGIYYGWMDKKFKSPFAPASAVPPAPPAGRYGTLDALREDWSGCPGPSVHTRRGVSPRFGTHVAPEAPWRGLRQTHTSLGGNGPVR
jgi:hypothetical protein